MGRYDILMGRDSKKEPTRTLEFGFKDDPDIKGLKHRVVFKLGKGERTRIGILMVDKETMFKAYNVHYHSSGPFLCKSTPGHKSMCCSLSYKGSRPTLRIATIVYVPNKLLEFQNLDDTTVLPWVFGKSTFDKLKELHRYWDLDKNDFFVTDISGNPRFQLKTCPYMFKQVDDTTNTSLSWINHPQKDTILQKASNILKDIKKIVAEDLDLHEIRDRIEQEVQVVHQEDRPPPRPRWGDSITARPATQVSDQEFVDDLGQDF